MLLDGYKTIELLGKGARSEIHHVVRVRTGEHFALKRVVRERSVDDRFIEQTLTDFSVSHAVRHLNLRCSYEIHRKRQWFSVSEVLLLMEYVQGITLDDAYPAAGRRVGESDIAVLALIFGQIIDGLQALHTAGYLHADMKPNNVILAGSDPPQVKIIDFGQSCHIGVRKERVQGTPDFIAPEQVARRTLDRRTDVFNLGATMYWVLTGKTYPTDTRLAGNVRGHDITDPDKTDPPHVLNAAVPPGLSKLVMDCCRQNPAERPPDMRQLRGRLATLQNLWKGAAATPRAGLPPTIEDPAACRMSGAARDDSEPPAAEYFE